MKANAADISGNAASMPLEAIKASFTYEYEKASSLEQTVTYTATSGEDMIALYALPVELFEFTLYMPNEQGGYTQQIMAVNIPHTAAVKLISLSEYEKIASDFQGLLPQVSGNALTHELGDPVTGIEPAELNYQWQKYSGNSWKNIGGAASDSLTYKSAGSDPEVLHTAHSA